MSLWGGCSQLFNLLKLTPFENEKIKKRTNRGWKKFEMISYILHLSLSKNNSSLQEFQPTCRQGVIWTVASTDEAITNMHFLIFTTFIGDSEG